MRRMALFALTAALLLAGCDGQSLLAGMVERGAMKETAYVSLDDQLKTLAELGYQAEDPEAFRRAMDRYNASMASYQEEYLERHAYTALLEQMAIGFWSEAEGRDVPYTDKLCAISLEARAEEGAYADFLERMVKLCAASGGELPITDAGETLGDPDKRTGERTVTLSFRYHGATQIWEAGREGEDFNWTVLRVLNKVVRDGGGERYFYAFQGTQTVTVLCATEAEAKALEEAADIRLDH